MADTLVDAVRDWAASGVVALTGHAGGPPLLPPGRGASRARELAAVLALAGVDVDGAALLGERAAFTGHRRSGAISAGGACRLLPSADGWAAVSCARPDDPLLLGALIGAEIDGDPWPPVAGWLRGHTGAELAERAELLGLAAAPVRGNLGAEQLGPAATSLGEPSAAELLGSAADPVREPPPTDRGPGRPIRSAAADTSAIPRGPTGAGAPDGPALRDPTGLRVVDFSALWAGPLCAHLLGLAGAEVITVETPQRPDGARRGHAGFYDLLHAGHRSVVFDPHTPRGRAALADLVAAADVVIEASRPRALAGFGLDARAVTASGTTWISITAAGRASNRVGFGDDVAAAAGLVAATATGPVFCGDAIADPLTGLTAAVAALTAPPGTLVDLSMTAVVAATLTPTTAHTDSAHRIGPAGRPGGTGWVLDTPDGPVDVRPPRHREPSGTAPRSGADTAAVFRALGLPTP